MASTGEHAGIDHDFAVEFAGRWAAAWNAHEPDGLLALMTDDIVYDDAAWPRTMRGHDEVREFLDSAWRAVPDLAFEFLDEPFLLRSAPKAVLHWHGTGTFTGPLDPPGFAPTGGRLAFDGFDLHEYRDGRVSRLEIVFDMADLSRQLGLLPAAGSQLERTTASLQRLGMRVKDALR